MPTRTTRPNNSSAPHPPSHTDDPVTAYAHAVTRGDIVAGPHVRAACRRHLRDLEQGPARGLTFRADLAARACGFFPSVLRLSDGAFAGQPFALQAWQAFNVGSLFGWVGADGFRRFRLAYIEVGKGNGKTPMAAGIGLYLMTADDESDAEVYAAATTRDQARILFQDAVKMVQQSPALSRRLLVSGIRTPYNIAFYERGSFFRPISSEGRALDGKRVHGALIDEVHEHPTATVVDKMRSGTKGRRQGLIVEITNSGFDRTSICFQHHEYSVRVVNGDVDPKESDTWFAYVCGLDKDDEPLQDPACWIKANPNLGVSIPAKYLEEQVAEARGMPAKQSIVLRLNFCRWVDAANPWIDSALWRACERDAIDFDALRKYRCVGALDLSQKKDLTAFAVAFESPDGSVDAFVEFWTPGATLEERAKRDRVPFDVWVREGFMHAPLGRMVDYDDVAARVGAINAQFSLEGVAFDPFSVIYFDQACTREGVSVTLIEHPQGANQSKVSGLSMPRSVEVLERLVSDGRLRVRRNPCLTWNAASAVLEPINRADARIFDKRNSKGRIDGLVALAMAVGMLKNEQGAIFDAAAAIAVA